VVERKEMVFPATILAAEATVDPREAALVNLMNAQGPTPGKQLLVNPQSVAVDVVAFLKKLFGDLNKTNTITDL